MTDLDSDLDTALDTAKLPERTVPLCLRGDLQAEYEDLERQLAIEEAKPEHDSLAGNPRALELEEQLEALREQMQKATVTLRVRALDYRAWFALADKHPAREGDDIDALYGCNYQTLAPELIRDCLVPKLNNHKLERLYSVLSDGQFETLFIAAHSITRSRVNVPKSRSVSAARRKPAETPS